MDSLAKIVRFSAVTVSEAAHVIQSMGRVLPDVNQGGLVKLATKVIKKYFQDYTQSTSISSDHKQKHLQRFKAKRSTYNCQMSCTHKVQSTLVTPTLVRTTKFVIMTI